MRSIVDEILCQGLCAAVRMELMFCSLCFVTQCQGSTALIMRDSKCCANNNETDICTVYIMSCADVKTHILVMSCGNLLRFSSCTLNTWRTLTVRWKQCPTGSTNLLASSRLSMTSKYVFFVICCNILLADRTNGRAIGTVFLPSVVVFVVCTECIVAKRCVLEQKLLLRAYRKSYMRNRLTPKWMTLTFVSRSYQDHVNHYVTFDVEYLRNRYR